MTLHHFVRVERPHAVERLEAAKRRFLDRDHTLKKEELLVLGQTIGIIVSLELGSWFAFFVSSSVFAVLAILASRVKGHRFVWEVRSKIMPVPLASYLVFASAAAVSSVLIWSLWPEEKRLLMQIETLLVAFFVITLIEAGRKHIAREAKEHHLI